MSKYPQHEPGRFDRSEDARGLSCPQPVIRARSRLSRMEAGQVLALLADDPLADVDLRIFCERTGHELLGADSREDGSVEYRIRHR